MRNCSRLNSGERFVARHVHVQQFGNNLDQDNIWDNLTRKTYTVLIEVPAPSIQRCNMDCAVIF